MSSNRLQIIREESPEAESAGTSLTVSYVSNSKNYNFWEGVVTFWKRISKAQKRPESIESMVLLKLNIFLEWVIWIIKCYEKCPILLLIPVLFFATVNLRF